MLLRSSHSFPVPGFLALVAPPSQRFPSGSRQTPVLLGCLNDVGGYRGLAGLEQHKFASELCLEACSADSAITELVPLPSHELAVPTRVRTFAVWQSSFASVEVRISAWRFSFSLCHSLSLSLFPKPQDLGLSEQSSPSPFRLNEQLAAGRGSRWQPWAALAQARAAGAPVGAAIWRATAGARW